MSFPLALPSKSIGTLLGTHRPRKENEAPRLAPLAPPPLSPRPRSVAAARGRRGGVASAGSQRLCSWDALAKRSRSLQRLTALSVLKAPLFIPIEPPSAEGDPDCKVPKRCFPLFLSPLDRPLRLRVRLAPNRGPGARRPPLMLEGWIRTLSPTCDPKGTPISQALKNSSWKKNFKSPKILASRNFKDGELEITCSERLAEPAGSFWPLICKPAGSGINAGPGAGDDGVWQCGQSGPLEGKANPNQWKFWIRQSVIKFKHFKWLIHNLIYKLMHTIKKGFIKVNLGQAPISHTWMK